MAYLIVMFRSVLSLALFAALAAPGLAATTDWVEIGPESRLRLVSDDIQTDNGVTRIGIEIQLAPGTRTYWRVPGETGIPLQVDFAGSSGIAAAHVEWPFPKRELRDGYLDYVYYGELVLPVTIATEPGSDSVAIRAALTLGVCSDICIPARADFDFHIDFERPDRASAFRLDAAAARVPIADDRSPPLFGAVAAGGPHDAIVVETDAPNAVSASLIVDSDNPRWLFGPPQNGPHSGLLELPVLAGGAATELIGGQLRLTFMTDAGPYELIRRVGAFKSVDSAELVE